MAWMFIQFWQSTVYTLLPFLFAFMMGIYFMVGFVSRPFVHWFNHRYVHRKCSANTLQAVVDSRKFQRAIVNMQSFGSFLHFYVSASPYKNENFADKHENRINKKIPSSMFNRYWRHARTYPHHMENENRSPEWFDLTTMVTAMVATAQALFTWSRDTHMHTHTLSAISRR